MLLEHREHVAEQARASGVAVGAETVAEAGGALWLWHPDGIGGSRMAEKATQVRLVGMGTARNWNTVMKLSAMVEGPGA
jgi:uncharacterized protein (DUF1697 family)